VLILQSNPKRYGVLIADLHNDHTRGIAGYPATIAHAYEMLVDYRLVHMQVISDRIMELCMLHWTRKARIIREEIESRLCQLVKGEAVEDWQGTGTEAEAAIHCAQEKKSSRLMTKPI